MDFKNEKNLFSISHNFYEVNYNNGGNEDFGSSDILNKLRVETPRFKAVKTAQMKKVALKNHIERRKNEIRERLSNTPKDEYGNVEVSGVVKADKYAEMKINDNRNYEYSERELAMKEWGDWIDENTEELPQAFDNAKKGTIEQKVDFIQRYGYLFDQGGIDESLISKEKYKELNDFVINFEQHKNRIRARLNNKNKEDLVSGVVVADKIAEGKINGIIDEPITPEKGKKLSDNVKRKIISSRQFER